MIAAGVVVVVIIAMALLIHGCQVSQTNNSLKTYAANVNSLVHDSNQNGRNMFGVLQKGELNSNQIQTLEDSFCCIRLSNDNVEIIFAFEQLYQVCVHFRLGRQKLFASVPESI